MIVPMKKVTIIIEERRCEDTILLLQNLGMIHIQYGEGIKSTSAEALMEKLSLIKEALKWIPQDVGGELQPPERPDPDTAAKHIVEFLEKRKTLEYEIRELKKEEATISPLGDFNPKSIKSLEKNNLFVRIYSGTEKEIQQLRISDPRILLGRAGKERYIAIVSDRFDLTLPLRKVSLPRKSLSEIDRLIRTMEGDISRVNNLLIDSVPMRSLLEDRLLELEDLCLIQRVRDGMDAEGCLKIVQGYCPLPKLQTLKKAAEGYSWGLLIRDPTSTDHTPTLLQNPEWIQTIMPVFRMLKTFPGYNEFDISFWFLGYLSIFFAFLVGDAGYGILFLFATHFVNRKIPKVSRQSIHLAYLFSGMTMLWGSMNGNWLGIEEASKLPVLRSIIIPSLSSFSASSQSNLMFLCFLVGASHLSIAHFLSLLRERNSLKWLSEMGWLGIVWGFFFLIQKLILGIKMPSFTPDLMLISALLVVFFTVPKKSPLKRLGIGFAQLVMKTVNCFSDIISYIRLFAVGMATVAVAVSFNEIASSIGFRSIGCGILSSIILVIGHGLNIIMVGLAVVVHGIRLNMLEFSGHLGMQWSGIEYNPFRSSGLGKLKTNGVLKTQ